MINEKIRGFVGLRADCEVIVQVNAQKFQQGRLRLQYIPYAKYIPQKTSLFVSNLTSRTSCPGIDIDICGGSNQETRISQAKFIIPFVSPHLYYNLITGDGTMGDIDLFVYSPLLSGTNEVKSCEVSIWARFITPKLAFPTGANPVYNTPTRRMQAQVRGEAKQVVKSGVISNTVGKIAETLHVAKDIPVIGSYLAIPEWIANKASNALKMFGFSKPTVAMNTKLRTTNCFANFNGQDSSHKMGLSADNEIDTPAGLSGTNIDEMALSTITSIPAYYSAFDWTTSQVGTDQILWVDDVSPYKPRNLSAGQIALVPVSYVANCFGLWRGSLVYTFKVVKTGFHTGRLRIYYTPYESLANLPVGSSPVNQIEKNYQMIFDIEESDTCTFTVPYVSTKPWLSVTAQESATTPVNVGTGYIVVTVLNELRAVSTVSSSISIIVEISGGEDLNFACPCAPRLQPANPPNDKTQTTIPPYHQEQHGVLSAPLSMEAQVYGTAAQRQRNEAQMKNYPDTISKILPTPNWSPESHCIGEKIMSIRQLIKRSNLIGVTWEHRSTDNIGRNVTAANYNGLNGLTVINPFANKINDRDCGIDYLSYFDSIFAFFRGGVRIKILSTVVGAEGNLPNADIPQGDWYVKPVNNNSMIVKMFNAYDQFHGLIQAFAFRYRSQNNALALLGYNGTDLQTYNALTADASSTILVNQEVEGMVEFEVPYYNSTHMSPNDMIIRTNAAIGDIDPTKIFPGTSATDDAYPLPIVLVTTPVYQNSNQIYTGPGASLHYYTGLSATYNIYRSAADDFGFQYIVGVPPMIVGTNVSTHAFVPSYYRASG
ncbi:hypothetical protein 2 [Hubei picorna-like virus 16]|uniref:hypothetical protein 2 n=1 Tax=Hubei picorna-like virus 16 TaxID=1923095 RepID=UPI0009093FCF|nr:hypothetical protein 2 [Hubei picorna-like virus 16]APG78037.1 hypothetical protein 2 [Hubei picorna-like virus 16]